MGRAVEHGRHRRRTVHQWMVLFGSLGSRLRSRLYYPAIFGTFGRGSTLGHPAALGHPQYIHIGPDTAIRAGARLEVVLVADGRVPELRIGSSVNIEQNVHIVCHNRVWIGDRVAIAANCAIVDTTHPSDGVPEDAAVGRMVLDDEGYVEIGEGTLLGFGCVVMPFVRIGRGCVIGANSVVMRDVPDFSVVAGAPARVLRWIQKSEASEPARKGDSIR